MNRQQQLERDLLALFESNPRRAIPLTEAVPPFAAWRAEFYRGEVWNPNTTQAKPYRDWFLERNAGLQAFATYEAGITLRHFAKNGTLRADAFIEAMVRQQIRNVGLKALSAWEPAFFDWEDFLKFKRMEDPKFFVRLGQWLTKGKDLDGFIADLRIKLYASLYDRATVPLQFCSDSLSAQLINAKLQEKDWPDWPGSKNQTNGLAVQGWRRLLKLNLANPLVLRLNRDGTIPAPNLKAAQVHGLPSVFSPASATQK